MTTTSTFLGMDEGAKPSSRVLQPPGGGSSNIFGSDDSSSRPAGIVRKPQNDGLVYGSGTAADTGTQGEPHSQKLQQPDVTPPHKMQHAGYARTESYAKRAAQVNADSQNRLFGDSDPEPMKKSGKGADVFGMSDKINPITGLRPWESHIEVSEFAIGRPHRSRAGKYNPITHELYEAEGDNVYIPPYMVNQRQGAYNPITQQGTDNEVPTPTKARQPPGGASQGLW